MSTTTGQKRGESGLHGRPRLMHIIPGLAVASFIMAVSLPIADRLGQLVPMFVAGFVLMAIVRSIGDTIVVDSAAFGLLRADQWSAAVRAIGDVWGAKYLLGTARAASGSERTFPCSKGSVLSRSWSVSSVPCSSVTSAT